MHAKNQILVEESVVVESREVGSEGEEWGRDSRDRDVGMALGEIRRSRDRISGEGEGSRDAITSAPVDERFGVKGEDLV